MLLGWQEGLSGRTPLAFTFHIRFISGSDGVVDVVNLTKEAFFFLDCDRFPNDSRNLSVIR
jgi:hypothetical protein